VKVERRSLEGEGWVRRFVTDESRVDEWVRLYTGMNYEVKVLPYEPAGGEECTTCYGAKPGKLKVIYTRKIRPGKESVSGDERRPEGFRSDRARE